MIYALDSNVIIHLFKGNGKVAEHLAEVSPSSLAIPAIALVEIERGLAKAQWPERRRQQLDTLLSVARVLPFDRDAVAAAASIMVELERAGNKIGPFDTLIAATALAHNATLVTHNQREFQRVPGLRTVDWFD